MESEKMQPPVKTNAPDEIYVWTVPSGFRSWSPDPRAKGASIKYIRADLIPTLSFSPEEADRLVKIMGGSSEPNAALQKAAIRHVDLCATAGDAKALKVLEKFRHEWSLNHGYTEHDTNAWILNEIDQAYLEAVDDCIEKIRRLLGGGK